jgi:hypothetical protein
MRNIYNANSITKNRITSRNTAANDTKQQQAEVTLLKSVRAPKRKTAHPNEEYGYWNSF